MLVVLLVRAKDSFCQKWHSGFWQKQVCREFWCANGKCLYNVWKNSYEMEAKPSEQYNDQSVPPIDITSVLCGEDEH